MRRYAYMVAGGAICVCCVLPAYEGVDKLPGQGQGGEKPSNAGSASDGGTSNPTQASGGEGANSSTAGTSVNAGTGGAGGSKPNTDAGANSGGTEPVLGGAGGEGPDTNSPTVEVPCPAGVLGHCAGDATYPTYAGYTLALVEDFPVPLDLDADPIFTWSDGRPAEGQSAFRKENFAFADGKLILRTTSACTNNVNCYPAGRQSYAEALSPNTTATLPGNGNWSAELRSKYNNYRYGRYEVKLKAPIANPGFENDTAMSGSYFATMFIFRSPRNVQWNEIDITAEAYQPTKISTNVLNAAMANGYPGGAEAEVNGPANFVIHQEHVYAFTWTPTLIEWFVDGKSIRTYDGSGTTKIPTLSAKIMLNLWVFASSQPFGNPANNKYAFQSEYDYFRFYKLDTETKYPCANPPACLDPADKTTSAQNNPSEVNYGK